MDKSAQFLSHYIHELLFISSSLQNEEGKLQELNAKLNNKTSELKKSMDESEEYNYDLDMRLQALIEQSDFLDILSPELERARIKKESVLKKQKEIEHDNDSFKQREMMISQQLFGLSEANQRLYKRVNKKFFESNYSYLTDDNDHDPDQEDDYLLEEKKVIEIINKKYRTLLPPRKSINEISPMRSRRRYGSIAKKKSMSTNTSLSQLNAGDSLSTSPMKTTDGVVNPNKSFYLLWNSRIQQSIANLTEITKEELGGHNCCQRLLKAYYHNIHFTNKVRSQSLICDQHVRSISKCSHREKRRKTVNTITNCN